MSFFSVDYKCDPPCREDEYCDEISGECVCHSSLRGEEICKLRQGRSLVANSFFSHKIQKFIFMETSKPWDIKMDALNQDCKESTKEPAIYLNQMLEWEKLQEIL